MNRRDRNKAVSDPQICLGPRQPSLQQRGFMMAAASSDIFERRATYGSLDTTFSQTSVQTPCCIVGEHFITSNSQEFIKRSLSLNSMVHVDITDINGDGEAPNVPLSLRRCKKMILTPYTVLLSIIGWRPWFKDSIPRCSTFWMIVNFFYPSIVILAMLYQFAFQILSCQGKYNVHVDTMEYSSTTVDVTTTTTPIATPKRIITDIQSVNCTCWDILNHNCTTSDRSDGLHQDVYCLHIVPTYIVPSVMHILAFAYGFLYFRVLECEQLYSLMERVFLQAYSTPGVQSILIRNSRLYLVGAFLWLLMQFGTELLYNFTYDIAIRFLGMSYSVSTQTTSGFILVTLKFVGLMLVQCVNVAVVLNYCVQCEMLVYHIKGTCLRLHEKTAELKDAMHEILGVRAFISTLNERMGRMVAFCVVYFLELTIVGTALLFLNQNTNPKVLAYRTIFPLLWFIALIVPLLQAARLTRVGSKLRQISFEMRVFGYQMASQLELDSFVLFVSGATLRAKLFGSTIRPATIILSFGGAVFIILTLMVVDLVTISGYKAI